MGLRSPSDLHEQPLLVYGLILRQLEWRLGERHLNRGHRHRTRCGFFDHREGALPTALSDGSDSPVGLCALCPSFSSGFIRHGYKKSQPLTGPQMVRTDIPVYPITYFQPESGGLAIQRINSAIIPLSVAGSYVQRAAFQLYRLQVVSGCAWRWRWLRQGLGIRSSGTRRSAPWFPRTGHR